MTETKLLPIQQPATKQLLLMEPDGVIVNSPDNVAPLGTMCLNEQAKTFIGQTPITFNEYMTYVLATGQDYIPDDRAWGRNNMPAVNISLLDVADYINWANPRVQWEYAYNLLQRMRAIDPNYVPSFPIPDNKEEWTGWPPPYFVDRANTVIYLLPRAVGLKIPTEDQWTIVKGNVEALAEKNGKETYGWISESRNMPLKLKEGHSVNAKENDDPDNIAYDVYGNVNEMVSIEEAMADFTKEREVMNRYYAQFPEWQAIVEPRVEEYFTNPGKYKTVL